MHIKIKLLLVASILTHILVPTHMLGAMKAAAAHESAVDASEQKDMPEAADLIWASCNNRPEIVNKLLLFKANPYSPTEYGYIQQDWFPEHLAHSTIIPLAVPALCHLIADYATGTYTELDVILGENLNLYDLVNEYAAKNIFYRKQVNQEIKRRQKKQLLINQLNPMKRLQ